MERIGGKTDVEKKKKEKNLMDEVYAASETYSGKNSLRAYYDHSVT